MGKAPVCSQEVHTYPSAFRYCTMHAAHITPCHSPQPWFAPWSITPQHLARSVLFLFWVTSHFRQREVWVLCKTFSKVVWPAGFWSSSRQLCCFCVLEGVGVLTLVCSLRDSIRVAAAHVEWVGVCKTTALEMNIPRKWKKKRMYDLPTGTCVTSFKTHKLKPNKSFVKFGPYFQCRDDFYSPDYMCTCIFISLFT